MNDIYIDIGSTNIKWKRSGEDVKTIAFPSPVVEEYPFFEVDANEIVRIVKRLFGNEDRAFFSVQMHGYVLLKDGKAVTNYISWRDERGKDETPLFVLTKEYGVDIKPNLPRLSLQTQKVDFNELCTLGSYIVYSLTGKNVTHITDAAPTGFYNVQRRTHEIVSFEVPKASYDVKKVGRYMSTDIYTPVGDQQAAILGATGKEFNGYILNLGTAAQMCCISKEFVSGKFESRPYFLGKTLCTVTRLIGGGSIVKCTDEEIEDCLVEEYGNALKKLPQSEKLLATGGVVKYRKGLLCKVLERLGVTYTFNEECDALEGLEIIAKGELE